MQVICHMLCATCMMGGAGKKKRFLQPGVQTPPQTISSPLSNSPPAFFGRHRKSPPEPQRAPSPSWSTKTERLEGGGTQHGKQESPTLSYNQLSLQLAGFTSCPGAKEKEITSVTATGFAPCTPLGTRDMDTMLFTMP